MLAYIYSTYSYTMRTQYTLCYVTCEHTTTCGTLIHLHTVDIYTLLIYTKPVGRCLC